MSTQLSGAGSCSGEGPVFVQGEHGALVTPNRERPAEHLDRVWPDTDPARKSLGAASRRAQAQADAEKRAQLRSGFDATRTLLP